MKRYAITSQKGGVGKTTTTGNVAWKMSEKDNVLVVDCDPQANLSQWMNKKTIAYDIGDVLMRKAELKDALIEIKEGMYLLPMRKNSESFMEFAEIKIFNDQNRFKRIAKELEDIGFAYVLYDLPPGLNKLERAVISSCDEAVTPVNPDVFGLTGALIFASRLNAINDEFDGNVTHKKIVVNELNMSYKGHNAAYEKLQTLDYDIFTIPQDRKLADSQTVNMSVYEYDQESRSISEINKLAEALL